MTNPNILRFELRPGVVLRLAIDESNEVSAGFDDHQECLLWWDIQEDRPKIRKLFPNGYTEWSDSDLEPAREMEAGE